MTIFGDANLTSAWPQFKYHAGTPLDHSMNYIFGSFLLLTSTISISLNPLVFYYNSLQRRTVVSALFQLLATLDTLFGLKTLWMVYLLMRPQQMQLFSFDKDMILFDKLKTITYYVMFGTSINVTSLLCLVRYIKIRAPMWAREHERRIGQITILCLLSAILFNTLGPSLGMFYGDAEFAFFSLTQTTLKIEKIDTLLFEMFVFVGLPFYITQVSSLLFSVLTICALRSDHGQQRKGIITIIWLNFGNVAWVIISLVGAAPMLKLRDEENPSYEYAYLTFGIWVMLQPILAAYNPLVICTRTSGIRDMMRAMLLKSSKRVGLWISSCSSSDSGDKRRGGRGGGYRSNASYGSTEINSIGV